MLGFNEFPDSGLPVTVPLPRPRNPRVALCYHRQCAWCLRLKHRDGEPHGHPWPRLPFYSHGICSICKAKLQRRVQQKHPHLSLGDLSTVDLSAA